MMREQRCARRLAADGSTAAMAMLLLAAGGLAPMLGNAGCGGGSGTGSEQSRALQSESSCTVWLERYQTGLRASVSGRRAVVSEGGRGGMPLVLEVGGQMMMGRRHMGVIRGDAAEDLPEGLSVLRQADGSLDAYRGRRHLLDFSAARVCSPADALLGASALLFEALPRL